MSGSPLPVALKSASASQSRLRALAVGTALALFAILALPVAPALAEGGGGGEGRFSTQELRERGVGRGSGRVQAIQRGAPFERVGGTRERMGTDMRRGGSDTGRGGRMAVTQPGRETRYPGRGHGGRRPWGAGAVGLGAGIIGGLILDQARRQPVYEPYEPEPEPPPRVRRPVVVEEYEDEAPVRRRVVRPVRAEPPPRRERAQRPAPPQPPAQTARPAPPRQPNIVVPPAAERRFVAEEVLVELAPNAQADAVLRRHNATLLASRRFELAGVTILRARLNGGRTARTALARMAGDRSIASAQPNYLYSLQQADAPASAGAAPAPVPVAAETASASGAGPTPSLQISPPDVPVIAPLASVAPKRELQPQYIVEKLHLELAHRLARGEKIKVAVIDSGADMSHPELAGVVAGSYDALGGEAQPHAHGTAMAAAILAQAQLQGVAPGSRLLAARAFTGGATSDAANGTTFHILSALDWAAGEGARVVNLSFAGPQDRLLSRALAGAKTKGMIAIAAAGNGGAKAAPLYPGADPNVIAVTATDADDKPFAGANRGDYVAIAAPGVDVLAAEPQGRYAFSSGTSIAAAHVSGLVALLLEKRPDLDIDGVRKLLSESAVDLGPKGRDPIFGAGRIDASAALARALPVSAVRP